LPMATGGRRRDLRLDRPPRADQPNDRCRARCLRARDGARRRRRAPRTPGTRDAAWSPVHRRLSAVTGWRALKPSYSMISNAMVLSRRNMREFTFTAPAEGVRDLRASRFTSS
jgi:hypothetical protein